MVFPFRCSCVFAGDSFYFRPHGRTLVRGRTFKEDLTRRINSTLLLPCFPGSSIRSSDPISPLLEFSPGGQIKTLALRGFA